MKSLQIVGDSPYGGGDYLIIRWCRFLLSQGWQVDILATDPSCTVELNKISGLNIITNILIPRNIALLKDLQAFFQIIRLLRKGHYDVVHTYTATPGFLGRLAAFLTGVPVILHHQAGWTVTEFSGLKERIIYTPLEYLATAVSTKAICVSYATEQQAHIHHIAPPSKLKIICNGIEPEPFIAASQNGSRNAFRKDLGFPDNHILLGNTGRLAPQKDNGSLIRAIPFLKSLLPNTPFTLLLAGNGSDRHDLEDLISSLKISEHVSLLGFVEDIPAFLAAIDIFVSPSLWEGMSISLLEAMASCKPIVTTSILPNAELIEHEVTGLIVPPQSPELIANSIARFVQDPDLANNCSTAARLRVLDRYTIDRMFKETFDLYLDSLKKKKHWIDHPFKVPSRNNET